MDEPRILVSNEELFTVREAMRNLNRICAQIESGEISRAILTRKGKMIFAIVPLAEIDEEKGIF
jgi:antitoxin (DNA-binding transcriptional repressor) of toxin-antitoxin stability system